MPDAELVDPLAPSIRGHHASPGGTRVVPDVTAVFEASYQEHVAPSAWMQEQMHKCKLERSRQAYFVHSVPVDRVQELTMQLRGIAGHVFVTDLCEEFYCTFDRSWDKFVDGMAM
jgi:hypothetical protein